MLKRIVLPVMLIVALAVAFPALAQGTAPRVVRVGPAALEVPEGQVADVAVEVVEVEALYGFDVALSFDPQAVEVVDADPAQAGDQVALGTLLEPGFVVLNQVDNAKGTLHFAMTQLNPAKPKAGTGSLIVVHLRGKRAGTKSPLALTNAQLARGDGSIMATTVEDGSVTVGPSTGAAPTPLPAQGAGTPLAAVLTPAAQATAPAPMPTRVLPPAVEDQGPGLPTPWLLAGVAVVFAGGLGVGVTLARRRAPER